MEVTSDVLVTILPQTSGASFSGDQGSDHQRSYMHSLTKSG